MAKKVQDSNKETDAIRIVCLFLFVIYVAVLAYFLFLSDAYGRIQGYSEYRYNLVPFVEIKRFINAAGILSFKDIFVNLLGNVFAFAPFGALIRWVRNRKTNFFVATFYTFIFSLCIELLQLVTMAGVFDVDDLILNTIGGAIGYIFYFIVAKLFSRKGKKKNVQ